MKTYDEALNELYTAVGTMVQYGELSDEAYAIYLDMLDAYDEHRKTIERFEVK